MYRIYDFECPKCGKIIEALIEGNTTPECDECKIKMIKLPSAPSFHLKGNNWAKDNYGLRKSEKKT